MKLQKEYTDDHQVKIVAEFETELFEQFKRRAARKIAGKTKIPGFRPGKAPYQIVVAQIGEPSIVQEAVDLMLDEVYPQVLDEAGIKPSGSGSLESIDSQYPPIFKFLIPLEPEVSLGNYQEIRKDYAPEPFDEHKVEEFVMQVRRNSATVIPLEDASQEGNVVYLTLQAENIKPTEGEGAILIESKPKQILIPTEAEQNESEWPFIGFARQLIGHKAGEEIELTHKYPKSHNEELLANKKVVFKVTLQSVKSLELPDLDGEFLQSLGDYENPEQFIEKVRDRMTYDHQMTYDDAYYLELIDQFRTDATIKYPPQVLDEEIEKVIHRVEADLKRQGIDLETYLKIRQEDKETFIANEARPAAIMRLERSLVMDAFAKQQGIKLNEDRLKETMDQVLGELIADGNLVEVQKEMGSEKFANAVTMESANRLMEKEIRAELKKIATGAADVESKQKEHNITTITTDVSEESVTKPKKVRAKKEVIDASEDLEIK